MKNLKVIAQAYQLENTRILLALSEICSTALIEDILK